MTRAVALLLLVLAGCGRSFVPPAAGTQRPECVFDSDCSALRVCADGHCRSQCKADRDCHSGELCRPSAEPGVEVCLALQSASLCAFNSDCPAPQICGTDRHCHAGCTSDADCSSGDRCTAGACATVLPVVADGGCLLCGSRCVDLQNDPDHCGTCEMACPAGVPCAQGQCAPVVCSDGGPCNDDCLGAQYVALSSGAATVGFDPSRYTRSLHACGGQADGYFRFHLDQRSLVTVTLNLMAQDQTGPYFGGVGLLEDCSDAAVVNCAPDCSNSKVATVVDVLAAGDHLVVADFDATEGPTLLTLHAVALPDGVTVERLPTLASFDLTVPAPPSSGGPLCGGGSMAHAWWAPNACLSAGTFVSFSVCGSDPGVAAGFSTGATTALWCAPASEPCDGGDVTNQAVNAPDPYFFFVTASSVDGGVARLSGSVQ